MANSTVQEAIRGGTFVGPSSTHTLFSLSEGARRVYEDSPFPYRFLHRNKDRTACQSGGGGGRESRRLTSRYCLLSKGRDGRVES